MWTLVLSTALAAGFAVGEPGVAALGRGGAWTARADDGLAAWYAPSALGDLPRLARVEGQLVLAGAQFQPTAGAAVLAEPGAAGIPNVAVPLPRTPLWVAAGPSLTGAPWAWPADGAQRYSVITQSVLASDLLVAWGGSQRGLGAGLSAGLTTVEVRESQAITTALDGSTDPAFDVVSTLRARGLTPAVIASLRARRGPVTVAVTGRAPGPARLRGSLTSDFSANTFFVGDSSFGRLLDAPTATDDDVTVPLRLPATARVGLGLDLGRGDVELDLGWEGWSTTRDLRVSDVDLTIPSLADDDPVVTEDVVVPLGFRDVLTARLGGEWRPDDRHALRAGVGFATSAAPDTTRTPLVPDGQRLWGGLGGRATADLGPLRLVNVDWAVSPQIVRAPANDASVVAQVAIDPLSGAVGLGERVGGGRIDAWSATFALGVSRAVPVPPARPVR